MNGALTDLIPNYNERLLLAAEDIEAGNAYVYIARLYEVDADELKSLILERLENEH
jgi:hypothetical protein